VSSEISDHVYEFSTVDLMAFLKELFFYENFDVPGTIKSLIDAVDNINGFKNFGGFDSGRIVSKSVHFKKNFSPSSPIFKFLDPIIQSDFTESTQDWALPRPSDLAQALKNIETLPDPQTHIKNSELFFRTMDNICVSEALSILLRALEFHRQDKWITIPIAQEIKKILSKIHIVRTLQHKDQVQNQELNWDDYMMSNQARIYLLRQGVFDNSLNVTERTKIVLHTLMEIAKTYLTVFEEN